jgi:tripartite-type tricarboxylate transporter receptor subunit TctC
MITKCFLSLLIFLFFDMNMSMVFAQSTPQYSSTSANTLATPGNNPAQNYPNKPVRIVVGYGPGGTGDITVRLVAQKLSETFGQSFVIENKPSAGGIVASQAVQFAQADGYTLNFIAAGNFAMTPSLFKSLPFDPAKDFEMVSLLGTFGFALAVNASSPYKDLKDFLDDAKSKPGRLFIGTISPGSAQHLSAELFKSMAHLDVTLVTYKTSADVLHALKAGDVSAIFETLAPLMPQVKSNGVRLLGITDESRFVELPDVPTMAQAGLPRYAVVGWNGLAAPKKTPREIILKLNQAINEAVNSPELKQKFADLGVTAKGNTPEQMQSLLVNDIQWWREIIGQFKIEKQ